MTHQFFTTVLPSAGPYCVVAIDDREKRIKSQSFVETTDELDAELTKISKAGYGAFMALAGFKSTGSRSADNAACMRSIFVDIDAGPGKPYAAPHDAAVALKQFVTDTKLPSPAIVMSGGGLHAYWPFTSDIPISTWIPAARAFKSMCITHGLRIDPAVTADAARILRAPGTSNWKTGTAREVQLAMWGSGQTDFIEFSKLLPAQEADLSAAKVFGVDAATRSMAEGVGQPAKFALLVQRSFSETAGCAQIRNAVTNAATLEEPLWRAALSVAWNCTDGETAIHKLSSGHPEYTPEDTTTKAERLTGKPYTCEWYRSNYADICGKCKHKVTSPIQLGTFVEEATADGDEYVMHANLSADTEETNPDVEVRIPKYPYPYFRGINGGVYKKEPDADGNLVDVEIYANDIYVTGRFYDSDELGDGEGELVGINLHLPHDGIRRFSASVVQLLAQDKLRDVLVKHGVVAYGKQVNNIMAYLAAAIRKLQSSVASSKTRSQMGWTPDNTFVVGELEYTPAGVKLAPPASGTRQLAPLFHAKGTLAAWSSVINFYNTPGMEGHAFGFLVGMGSPLLRLLNSTQVRGAVLNLVSNGSGTGKTTVQLAINSLFGHPSELLMEAKDTPASRFHRLGTLNSICMTVDELTNASGEQLSALVYGATSGRAPHRMEAQSNKLRSNHTTWCSVTVTSSNAVMAEALAAHRTAVEGELKRVIDWHITVPTHIPKHESDALFAKLADNYGVAGAIYLPHLVDNADRIAQALADLQQKLDTDMGFERNDRFYSAVCAVAIMAGHIGNKLGLFQLDVKRIYEYAVVKIAEVKASNALMVGDAGSMAMETLAAYLGENVNNGLIINAPASRGVPVAPIAVPRGPLKFRYEPDTDQLLIPAPILREYFVNRRVDFKASVQAFKDQGVLVTHQSKTALETTIVRRVAAGAIAGMNAPAVRCYVFNGSKLGMKIPDADGPAADSEQG